MGGSGYLLVSMISQGLLFNLLGYSLNKELRIK